MAAKKFRLDRFVAKAVNIPIKQVRLQIALGNISVDDLQAMDPLQQINQFSKVIYSGTVLQELTPVYIMLNKPVGVVSATKDTLHKTVLDIIDHPLKHSLHIVGRLDLNTTGLVLLTNDSLWSKQLMHADSKVPKKYLVQLKNKISEEYIDAFSQGMFFKYEGITTAPAQLVIKSEFEAEVTLTEGRYHQIKRMFGRYRNPVIALQRFAIGELTLDNNLMPGQWRSLSEQEALEIF